MVVICDSPMLSTEVIQERIAAPSICTVHALHSAMPHPSFVPVMPSTSRNTQSSGVSPSTSTLRVLPLTLMLKAMASSPFQRPAVETGHHQPAPCAETPEMLQVLAGSGNV